MASPKEVFENIKKAASAMNPFGGNATPPKEDKPIPKEVIKKKGEQVLKDLDKDKVAR